MMLHCDNDFHLQVRSALQSFPGTRLPGVFETFTNMQEICLCEWEISALRGNLDAEDSHKLKRAGFI